METWGPQLWGDTDDHQALTTSSPPMQARGPRNGSHHMHSLQHRIIARLGLEGILKITQL